MLKHSRMAVAAAFLLAFVSIRAAAQSVEPAASSVADIMTVPAPKIVADKRGQIFCSFDVPQILNNPAVAFLIPKPDANPRRYMTFILQDKSVVRVNRLANNQIKIVGVKKMNIGDIFGFEAKRPIFVKACAKAPFTPTGKIALN